MGRYAQQARRGRDLALQSGIPRPRAPVPTVEFTGGADGVISAQLTSNPLAMLWWQMRAYIAGDDAHEQPPQLFTNTYCDSDVAIAEGQNGGLALRWGPTPVPDLQWSLWSADLGVVGI